jgi:hypothetical protein
VTEAERITLRVLARDRLRAYDRDRAGHGLSAAEMEAVATVADRPDAAPDPGGKTQPLRRTPAAE